MSKSSIHQKIITLNSWLEQTKKNNKYGRSKRIILEDDVDIHFVSTKRKK
jgi:hypothetical protein